MSDASIINNVYREPYSSTQAFHGDEEFLANHPWVRHYEQGGPAHIAVPDYPLTWLLESTVSRYPDHTAFIYYGTKLTYAQFACYADRFAGELQRLGVQKGERVAIALPNIPQFPVAFYGALRAGAIVVPTNPLYTEREMQYQLADSQARVMVMLDTFYPVVRAIRKQTALEHVIVTSPADFLPPMLRALYPLSQRRAEQLAARLTHKELQDDHALHTLLEPHNRGDGAVINPFVPVDASDLAALQYTGGTTGLSKGAMLTHRNLLADAMQARLPKRRSRPLRSASKPCVRLVTSHGSSSMWSIVTDTLCRVWHAFDRGSVGEELTCC